jgi:hypothetical protein
MNRAHCFPSYSFKIHCYIMTYLKRRMVEPEDTAFTRQRRTKHMFAETDTHTKIEKLRTAVFLCGPCGSYKTRACEQFRTHVEVGSNTSTVTMRVVGGDEKGSLKTETVKYGREIQGTRIRGRLLWRGPAAYTKDRPVLSSERAPHKNKTVTVKK